MIKPPVTRFVELDGTVSAARSTVCLMMMTHTDITPVTLAQEKRFVDKTGMDQAVKYIVPLGMTPWLVTTAIPRAKEFVCRTGMAKTSATLIVNRPMIPKPVTPAT